MSRRHEIAALALGLMLWLGATLAAFAGLWAGWGAGRWALLIPWTAGIAILLVLMLRDRKT